MAPPPYAPAVVKKGSVVSVVASIFCGSCGQKNPSANRFCASCGDQLMRAEPPPDAPTALAATSTTQLATATAAGQGAEARAPQAAQAPAAPKVHEELAPVLEALIYPFRNPNWPVRLWWVPLVNLVPIFGLIVMRGWRLDITRRMSQGDPDRLPKLADFGRFFGDGVVLWIMTGLYYIPQIIILSLFAPDLMTNIWSTVLYFWSLLAGDPMMTFGQYAASIGVGLLTQAGVPILYQLVSLPIYRTAMLRYAITGNMLVFFDFITSARLCMAYFSGVMAAVFATLAANFLINVVLSGVIAATFVGAPLIPLVTIPVSYWVVGYIYGSLARRMAEDLK